MSKNRYGKYAQPMRQPSASRNDAGYSLVEAPVQAEARQVTAPTIGLVVVQLPGNKWQCTLTVDGISSSKGPLERRLFLREYHRALEVLNERTLRNPGMPHG